MHETILKAFGFFKSFTQFMKIVVVFCILMLLMYWVSNLAGYNWAWLGFISPLLDSFINVGAVVSSGSIVLFKAVFEFKYFIALVLFLALYFVAHFAFIALCVTEEIYINGRNLAKKLEEDRFNAELQYKNTIEQKRIKHFTIYVEPVLKERINTKLVKIDMEEQTRIMNKFLIDKTSVAPRAFEQGFVYNFSPFDDVDKTLDVFNSLFNNDSPLDYIICVQVIDSGDEIEHLKHLVSLRFVGKIVAWSDTVYRYTFNKNCKYETTQLGLFQRNGATYEAHEFERKLI